MDWFECKVKFDKEVEEGKLVSTSESYLIEGASYTDAETRVIEEVRPLCGMATEFEVANIKRAKYADMHFSQNELDSFWFKVKIVDLILDEEKGTERKVPCNELFQAENLQDCVQKVVKYMDTTSRSYEIASVNITSILDVLPLALDKPLDKPAE